MENGGIYSDRADREVWQAMGVVMGRWRVHFLTGLGYAQVTRKTFLGVSVWVALGETGI